MPVTIEFRDGMTREFGEATGAGKQHGLVYIMKGDSEIARLQASNIVAIKVREQDWRETVVKLP